MKLTGTGILVRRAVASIASVERKGSGAGVGRTADAYAAAGIAAQAAEVAGAVAFGLGLASVPDGRDQVNDQRAQQKAAKHRQQNGNARVDWAKIVEIIYFEPCHEDSPFL